MRSNPFDQRLSAFSNKLGVDHPFLLTASIVASLGADEDVAIPLYLAFGLLGTLVSWSLVSNHLELSSSLRNNTRNLGNCGLDMIMVWVVTCAVESSIKIIVRRARPMQRTKLVLPGDLFSFPSGHTMRGFYYYVPYLFTSRYARLVLHGAPSLTLAPIAIAAAGLTGFSRIARCRHWPTDVIVGGALGCVLGAYFEALEQQTRLWFISYAVYWAVCSALLQYIPAVRRLFEAKEASGEWTLFVIIVVGCWVLYQDDSVQA